MTGTSHKATSVSPVTPLGLPSPKQFPSVSPLSPLSPVQKHGGAVGNDVGIDCGAFSGGVKVSAQAARSTG